MKKDDCEETAVESIWSSQRHLEDKLKQEVHAGWHHRERKGHVHSESRTATASLYILKSNQIRLSFPWIFSEKDVFTFMTWFKS